MNRNHTTPPRRHRITHALEAARDANDPLVLIACRRLLEADRLGWRKYSHKADWDLIRAFGF